MAWLVFAALVSLAVSTALTGSFWGDGSCSGSNVGPISINSGTEKCQHLLKITGWQDAVYAFCRGGKVQVKKCTATCNADYSQCTCGNCEGDYTAYDDDACISIDEGRGKSNGFRLAGCKNALDECETPAKCVRADNGPVAAGQCKAGRYGQCLECEQGYFIDGYACSKRKECENFGCGLSRIGMTCALGTTNLEKLCTCPDGTTAVSVTGAIAARNNCPGTLPTVSQLYEEEKDKPLLGAVILMALSAEGSNSQSSVSFVGTSTQLAYSLEGDACSDVGDDIEPYIEGFLGREVDIRCGALNGESCTGTSCLTYIDLTDNAITQNYEPGIDETPSSASTSVVGCAMVLVTVLLQHL